MENKQSDSTTNPLLYKTYLQEKLDAVSLYVQKGWYVLPLDHIHGKKPINNGGRNNPYKFPEDAEKAWAVKHPLANVGIVTGQESLLYVIDIDGKGDDYEVFKRCLPKTSEVRTSKGMHYYYNRPEKYPHKLGNKVRNLIPGMDIDVRCDGGYVVAPPSINPVTQYKYQFVDEQETAIAPNWLLELHTARSTTNAPKEIQELYAKYDKELSKEEVKIEERRNGNQIDLKSMQKITDKIILAKIDEASNAGVGERNKLLNDAVFTMAGLIHTGVISESEVADIGYEIANANGLLADDGQRSILAVIRSGIASGLSKRLTITRVAREKAANRTIEATEIMHQIEGQPESGLSRIVADIKLTKGKPVMTEIANIIRSMDFLYMDISANQPMVGRDPPWGSWHNGRTKHPRMLEDVDAIELAMWAEANLGIHITKAKAVDIIDSIVSKNRRDLLKEYVQECARKWDGVPRVRNWVQTYLGVTPTPISLEFGFRWMLQVANRALHPGCKAEGVLIMEGAQGIGKSTALRNLVPDNKYFLDDLKDFIRNPKDSALECSKCWIAELSENHFISTKDVELFKQFVSKQEDKVRLPYARNVQELLRRINFAATTNQSGYLRDTTGNRRFYPIKIVGKIDTNGIERDRDNLWGESVMLLTQGQGTYLSSEHHAAHEEQTNDRLSMDAWHEEIELHINKAIGPITTGEILNFLNIPIERQGKREQNRVCDVLRRLGYQQANKRHDGRQLRQWIKGSSFSLLNDKLEPAQISSTKKPPEKTYDVVIPEDDDDYGF